jgi:hypothetical protein
MPLSDKEKTIIGPEIINRLTFYICRVYPSIPYQLPKYALVNCPQLVYFELTGMNSRCNIKLSPHDCNPYDTFKTNAKVEKVKVEGVSPTQEYLDMNTHLPDTDTIMCADRGHHFEKYNRTYKSSQLDSFPQIKGLLF